MPAHICEILDYDQAIQRKRTSWHIKFIFDVAGSLTKDALMTPHF